MNEAQPVEYENEQRTPITKAEKWLFAGIVVTIAAFAFFVFGLESPPW